MPEIRMNITVENAPVIEAPLTRHVFVCTGKSCSAADSQSTLKCLSELLAQHGLLYGKRGSFEGSVLLTECSSVGLCQVGPAVMVYPEGIWYYNVQPKDVPEIIEQHFMANKPVERLMARKLPKS